MTDLRHSATTRQSDDDPARTTRPVLLITVGEAARMLSIGRTAVYQLIWSGDLTTIHIGRSARLRLDEVEEFARTGTS